jgi:hypothetical protein
VISTGDWPGRTIAQRPVGCICRVPSFSVVIVCPRMGCQAGRAPQEVLGSVRALPTTSPGLQRDVNEATKPSAPDLLFERGTTCGVPPESARHRRLNCARAGTPCNPERLQNNRRKPRRPSNMGRGLLLWLIGIPLPIILLLYVFGFLS